MLVTFTALQLASGGNAMGGPPSQFVNGLHCAKSPYVTGDILPESGNKPGTWVISIRKIEDNRGIVGYVYEMKDGVALLQPTNDMPSHFLEALDQSPLQLKRLPGRLPEGLRVVDCSADEMKTRLR